MGIEAGIKAAGYVIATKGVRPDIAQWQKRCSFFGCKAPIRAGELHVTMWGRRGRPPESMHLACSCRRCWLKPVRALKNLEAVGGLGSRINEMRERAGLSPIEA